MNNLAAIKLYALSLQNALNDDSNPLNSGLYGELEKQLDTLLNHRKMLGVDLSANNQDDNAISKLQADPKHKQAGNNS